MTAGFTEFVQSGGIYGFQKDKNGSGLVELLSLCEKPFVQGILTSKPILFELGKWKTKQNRIKE